MRRHAELLRLLLSFLANIREQQPAHDTPVMVDLGLPVRVLGESDLAIDVSRSSGNTRWETEWRVASVRITHITVDEAQLFLLGSESNKELGTMDSCRGNNGEFLTAVGS
jgi:hypothetical protein